MNEINQKPNTVENLTLAQVNEFMPYFVNHTLEGNDLTAMNKWMDNHLASHPEIQAEMLWLERSAQQMKQHAYANIPSPEVGLDVLMQRIKEASNQEASNHAAATPFSDTHTAQPLTWVKRLQNLEQRQKSNLPSTSPSVAPNDTVTSQPLGWVERLQNLEKRLNIRSPALAFGAMALLLIQTGVIGALLFKSSDNITPLGGEQTATVIAANQTVLIVAFRPDASESSIRELLLSVDGQIISGPTALGLYEISVPKNNVLAVTQKLQSIDDIVESVQ